VLRGLLTWDLSAQYTTRLREENKALQEAGQLISRRSAPRRAAAGAGRSTGAFSTNSIGASRRCAPG